MKLIRLLLFLLSGWASWAVAAAPLVVAGEPAIAVKALEAPRLRLTPAKSAVRHVELSDLGDAAIEEVRAENLRSRASKMRTALRRVAIGLVRPADTPASRLAWLPVEGGFAARVSLRSPQADALRLSIDLAGAPDDLEMVFFGSANPARLEGPVRAGDVRDRSSAWWSPLTEGDAQTVELFLPSRHDPASLPVRLTGASHLVTTPSSGFTKRLQDIGKAGSCNVDVPCSPLSANAAFRDAAAAVAQMVFSDGSYSYLCSGTLMNDADPSSQVPYFLSANHCFDRESPPYRDAAQMQAIASSLTTIWGFEADSCGGGRASSQPLTSWTQRSGGATHLYNDVQSDALLLRLNDAPPAGAFFAGWDATAIAPGSAVTAIHHPQGDLKKVSQGTVQRLSAPGVGGGNVSFIEVMWNSGTTEGGSSGGGLWSTNGSQFLYRGALWGGTALCGNPSGTDFFSRFDAVYPSIARYLAETRGGAVTDYTDLWWNPDESGWGLNLIQHPSRMIFGVWYTYASNGRRTWYVMPSGAWTSDNVYTGPLYETAGPHIAQAFDASKVRVSPVGNATLTFSDADHGTFAFSVNGASGSKAITRQPF